MLRGDVRAVDLDPAQPGEANKRRPAVIVSNDGANASASRLGRGVVTVVPLTSNTERVFPFQVFIPAQASGLPRDSKAQAEQVRAVSMRFSLGRSTPAMRATYALLEDRALALGLIMLGVFANDTYFAFTADHFALVTNLFYRCSYFHDLT